jgi:excisionase family DNA binding protein
MNTELATTRGARSVEETAAWTGLSEVYIRRAIKSGRLHAVRAGRRILVPEEAAVAFLRSLPKAS